MLAHLSEICLSSLFAGSRPSFFIASCIAKITSAFVYWKRVDMPHFVEQYIDGLFLNSFLHTAQCLLGHFGYFWLLIIAAHELEQ